MMMSKIAFHRKRPLLLLKVFSSELLFKSPSSASFSTNIVGQSPILVRDFIRSALYDPNHGYFSKRPGSVGLLERSIKFNNLQGRSAYLRHLNNLYKQNDIAWFTPVELFKPWYAHGIAEAILRTADLSVPLKVLDNFPHDLIYSENQVSPWMEVWLQKRHDSECISELYKPLQDPLISRCIEIIDMDKNNTTLGSKAISATRSIWSKIFPQPRRVWLPTGCLQLLDVLHWALPKMSLIASDFSYLPDVKISGERAPLVSTKKDGSSADYSSYLDAKGDADIFFPTDFWLLERIDHHCSGWLNQQPEFKSSKQMKRRRTIILDTAAFMEEFGLPSKTRTKDGYNPLLDDFKNTKFYLSVPTHNKR
ncbi:uncharacterized protein LOC131246457 isoform X2 [Magnolia sinica]|uniref:uncharacterized protein LOC131246457 isoform X2 n=1 Tax=Magnolia sinica TaxID=86752 RepID=UPI00265B210B|nr:uncharacterized protein LOC131246457 isoform X2 [Magnolia sinica]